MNSPSAPSIVQVSALILARGCSKSIVKKNVKKFLNVPLVCHSVKVALECNHFASVWISTDDGSLADLVTHTFALDHSRVHIHMRSSEGSSDTATSLQSVCEFLTFREDNDAACYCRCCVSRADHGKSSSDPAVAPGQSTIKITALIQCTSPILHFKHLQSACEFILANGQTIQSIFSAFTHGTSLEWRRSSDSQKYMPVNFDAHSRPRRQNMIADSTYVESGHFYFFNNLLPMREGLLQSLESGKQAIYAMHPACCIELDEEYQWEIAEALYKIAQNNNFYLHQQIQPIQLA